MYSRYMHGILFTRFNSKIPLECRKNVNLSRFCHNQVPHGKSKWYQYKINVWLREQSILVFKACTRQCEFIVAQRIRRGVQIFHLYSKIWDEGALKEFINIWRRKVARNTKNFLLGTAGITLYDWDKERIPDAEMYSYLNEIDNIHKLRESTVVCSKCNLRLIIDHAQDGVEYCQCKDGKYISTRRQDQDWEPFIERKDMIIWRREEKNTGLYAYKVYGSFPDVSAEDFLQVQIDINYRKEWDATAKELEIIDTDNRSKKKSIHTQSDIIYWEMIWPRMFSNRDYVYQRRWLYDQDKNIIVIISKGTDHPNAPNKTDAYRVTTYWSFMVIKPYNKYKEPGIEFGLTYFDDPGVNIPSAVTTWVAMSGLPDYLCRMRQAGRDYKKYKDDNTVKSNSPINTINFEVNESTLDESNNGQQQDDTCKYDPSINPEESNQSQNKTQKNKPKDHPPKSPSKSLPRDSKSNLNEDPIDDQSNEADDVDDIDDDNRGFLHYFLLAKLFA